MYVMRRPSGWRTPEELQVAAARSRQVGDDEMSADIRWIRSYVVHERDGGLGTLCIYRASRAEKIREHAERALSRRPTSSRSPTPSSFGRIPLPSTA